MLRQCGEKVNAKIQKVLKTQQICKQAPIKF